MWHTFQQVRALGGQFGQFGRRPGTARREATPVGVRALRSVVRTLRCARPNRLRDQPDPACVWPAAMRACYAG